MMEPEEEVVSIISGAEMDAGSWMELAAEVRVLLGLERSAVGLFTDA